MDPFSLAAFFGPLVMEGGKALIQRFISPDRVKPATIPEAIALMQAETERFRAINDAGGTEPSYPWVAAIIRLQRPFVVTCTMLAFSAVAAGAWEPDPLTADMVGSFAQAIAFYLFGDRTLAYSVGKFATKGGAK